MKFTIYNRDLVSIGLDKRFRFEIAGTKFSKKTRKFRGRHGGDITGDRTAQPSRVSFKWTATATSDNLFIDKATEVEAFLMQGKDPYHLLIETDDNPIRQYRYLIDTGGFDSRSAGELFARIDERTLDFFTPDVFPEDEVELNELAAALNDTDTYTFFNDGHLTSYPILEVTALANILNFTLENVTEETHLTIDDASFTAGKTYVFDFSDRGSVNLVGVGGSPVTERSKRITDGGPLSILPGNNEFRYLSSSGPCSVRWRYRRVWLRF